MTRLRSIQAEIARILEENADVIEKKALTSVQITLRLYPNGGLVRKSHFHTESENEKVAFEQLDRVRFVQENAARKEGLLSI